MPRHWRFATPRMDWVAAGVALLTLLTLPAPPCADAQAVRDSLWVTDGFVNSIVSANNAVYIGGYFSRVGPATGGAIGIDRSTGAAILPYPKVAGWVYAVAADGAGGWYVGGLFSGVGGQPRKNLAHFDASGVLDAWAPEPDGEIRALAVYDGVLYASGLFLNVAGQARARLAAFDVVSGDLTNWDPGCSGRVYAFAPGEGTIYVGGLFDEVGGQLRHRLAELDLVTGAATAFDPDLGNGIVYSMVRDPLTGRLFVGGSFSSVQAQPRRNVAAFDVATGLLTSWAPEADGIVYSLGAHEGTVYAGGNFANIGGAGRTRLAALDASTGAATSWNPGANGIVNSLVIVASNDPTPVVTVHVGGVFTSVGAQPRKYAAAVGSDGTLSAWNPEVNQEVFVMGAAGNSIYCGGRFTSVGGVARSNAAAFDATTSAILPWDPQPNGAVNAILASGATIFLGGGFTTVQGQVRSGVAAVDPTSGAPTAWSPGVQGQIHTMVEYFGTLYLGGSFSFVGGVPRDNAAAVDVNTGATLAFDPGVNSTVRAMAIRVQSSFPFTVTVYLGGSFSNVGGQYRPYLASVEGSSGVLNAWDAKMGSDVYALVYSSGTLWIGGTFGTINFSSRTFVGAVDATTAELRAWDPGANDYVFRILPGPGVFYLGGRFTTIGGQPRAGVAAVDATTGALLPWNPRLGGIPGQFNGHVTALAQSNGTIYAGGTFTTVQFTPHQGFAGFTDVTVTAVDETPAPPSSRSLVAEPNPTASGADLRFSLAHPAHVSVEVFDVSGRLVRRLHRGVLPSGSHRLRWNGLAEGGAPVGSGVYLLRLETPAERRTAKVMIVR